MTLPDLWFGIVAVLWTGFFVLEGFDFGVGALHRLVGRNEDERRVAINTIGPFWDGNEVWLVVGGAGIFAAFPDWYATWFSASYLAIVLLLMALIMRGVSFEFRGKVDVPRWRHTWSGTLTIGSLLAPLVIGIALGDLLAGLPVDRNQEYTGSFLDLFTPFGLWTALTLVLLCLLHGATFLALRTTAGLRARALRLGRVAGVLALAALVVFVVWTTRLADVDPLALTALVAAPVLVVASLAMLGRRDGLTFAATALAMTASVGSLFAALYPNVLVSSTSAAFNLTVQNTASGDYALQVMTVTAAIFMPLVLLYQGWAYVVFRRRLSPPAEQPPTRTHGAGEPASPSGEPPPASPPVVRPG
ncbi:MAG TPA: cytochrome d ubiquinol oxidase subunit II [Nocardioidaceae bacterium]|nr:cytochrome d ubiquinol oxidase subunit II [Nocardioidaceae bacterium]